MTKYQVIAWLFLIFVTGCAVPKLEIKTKDGNVNHFEGKIAEKMADAIIANEKTAQGRVNDINHSLQKTVPFFMFLFVGGCIFWGFSRSKWGWVIPAASISGIVLVYLFAQWVKWITAGVLVIAVALLVWKALEYQAERNKVSAEKRLE